MKKEIKYELLKIISLISFLIYPLIRLCYNEVVLKRIESDLFGNIIFFVALAILIFPGIIAMFITDIKKVLKLCLIFITVIIANYIFHFNNFSNTINIIIKFGFSCYIPFMLTITIKDKEKLFKMLNKTTSIVIGLTFIYILYMINKKAEFYENSQIIAYQFGFFAIINIYYLLKKFNYVQLIITISSIIIIFYTGSRTILLGIILYVLMIAIYKLILFFKSDISLKKKIYCILILILLSILILIFIFNIQSIFLWIYNLLIDNGIYVRIFRLLSEGTFFSGTNGRADMIYPVVLDIIKEKPILGIGLGADRIEISNLTNQPYMLGLYSHNFIFEVLLSFGLIVGIIILILLSYIIYKSLKTKYIDFILCLICSGLFPLMLTSSFLLYRPFWVFLGVIICINNIDLTKNKHKFIETK